MKQFKRFFLKILRYPSDRDSFKSKGLYTSMSALSLRNVRTHVRMFSAEEPWTVHSSFLPPEPSPELVPRSSYVGMPKNSLSPNPAREDSFQVFVIPVC